MGRRRDSYYDEYRDAPWLRRQLDRMLYNLVELVRIVGGGFLGFLRWLFFVLPIGMFQDWWFRLARSNGRQRWWNLVLGLPALLAAPGLVFFGYMVAYGSQADSVSRYLKTAREARDKKDVPTAQLLFSRLRTLQSSNPEHSYELAILYEQQGELARARSLMTQIAPIGELGYPKAHLWLAEKLLQGRWTPQAADLARTHLNRILQFAPTQPEINRAKGEIDARTGRFADAETALRVAAASNPAHRLQLARVLLAQNRKADAMNEALAAERFFRDKVRQKPEDRDSRTSLCEALVIRSEYREAMQLLEEGERVGSHPSYPMMRARVAMQWALAEPAGSDRRWVQFQRAFELGPRQPEVLGAMLRAALDDAADEKRLRESIAKPHDQKADVSIHLILGMIASLRDKPGAASPHFEAAAKAVPQAPALFLDIVRGSRASAAAGLEMVAAALVVWPKEFDLRQLHAELLAATSRYSEAHVELNELLQAREGDPGLHAVMADVCRHLGLTERAAQHLRLANPNAQSEKK